ncbi:hypothetical protein Bca4012_010012 [Brassica carinata]
MADGEKQALTPKKTIHQRFGVKVSYMIEDSSFFSEYLSLLVPLAATRLFCCIKRLQEKQDSKQSAAELALEKDDDDDDITVEQDWDDVVQRIKFLSSDHPLGSHFRETLQRDGERRGSVPLSVITAFDTKINIRYKVINNRYKVINPSVS